MLDTLHQRNFTLLWTGGLVSMVGNWVLIAALPYYIYQRTDSALAAKHLSISKASFRKLEDDGVRTVLTGNPCQTNGHMLSTMLVCSSLPVLLLGSVSGVFVDRWDRRRTMVIANFLQAVLILVLLLVPSNDWLWLVYVVAFLESSISTFSSPAESALLPRLVGEEHLLDANSLNSLNDNLARLIGPPIGGALVGLWGLGGVVLVDAASYLFAAATISLISTASHAEQEDSGVVTAEATPRLSAFWREWVEGLHAVGTNRVIASLFVVAGIATFADSILSALLIPFVDDVLRAGSLGFGWLLTARGIGGLVGGVVVGQTGRFLLPVHLLALSNAGTGLLLLAMFNLPSYRLSLVLAGLVGVTAVGYMAAHQTVLQSGVPDRYLGRVFGTFNTMGALLSVGGLLLASALGDAVGILPLLNASGALSIAAGIVAFTLLERIPVAHHEVVVESDTETPKITAR